MKRIYKYPLEKFNEVNSVKLPLGAEILSCHAQNGKATLWALVDVTTDKFMTHAFYVFGTGWELDPKLMNDLIFIGTCFDGPLVWHVFKRNVCMRIERNGE